MAGPGWARPRPQAGERHRRGAICCLPLIPAGCHRATEDAGVRAGHDAHLRPPPQLRGALGASSPTAGPGAPGKL